MKKMIVLFSLLSICLSVSAKADLSVPPTPVVPPIIGSPEVPPSASAPVTKPAPQPITNLRCWGVDGAATPLVTLFQGLNFPVQKDVPVTFDRAVGGYKFHLFYTSNSMTERAAVFEMSLEDSTGTVAFATHQDEVFRPNGVITVRLGKKNAARNGYSSLVIFGCAQENALVPTPGWIN